MSKNKKKRSVKKRRNIPIPTNKKPKKITKLEYPAEYLDYFDQFITKNIGEVETIIHNTDPRQKLHVDIFVVPPDDELPYWKLITVGMSLYKQKQPKILKEAFPNLPDRSEYVMLLEPEWTYDQSEIFRDPHVEPSVRFNKNNNYLWPIVLLQQVASIPFYEGSCTYPGDVFITDVESASEIINFEDVLIKELQEFKTSNNCMILPNGEAIQFYQAVPIHHKEAEALVSIDNYLERLLKGEKIDNVLHPNREAIDLS